MLNEDSSDKTKEKSQLKADSSGASGQLRTQKFMAKNEKLSKTLSKNQMKLKMAAKIKDHKQDASDQEISAYDQRLDKSKENLFGQKSKKRIQLPLKIQNLKKTNMKNVGVAGSLERVVSKRDQENDLVPVYGNVAIKNIRNSTSIGDQSAQQDSETIISSLDSKTQMFSQVQALKQFGLTSQTPMQKLSTKSRSPQTRVMQGHQGKMISQRLEMKDVKPATQTENRGAATTKNSMSNPLSTQQFLLM